MLLACCPGSHDWTDLIRHDGITKPREIPEELRRVLIKYGELTQITYDSFYGDAKDTATFGEAHPLHRTAKASR